MRLQTQHQDIICIVEWQCSVGPAMVAEGVELSEPIVMIGMAAAAARARSPRPPGG